MDAFNAGDRQELDHLRRRAWGKGAAGALTALEQQRLAELEGQIQRGTRPLISGIPTAGVVPPTASVGGEDASLALTSAPDQNRAAASWIRRMPPWLVASLALVVGVALGLVVPTVFVDAPDARLALVGEKDPSDLDPQYADYFTWAWVSTPDAQPDTVRVYQEFRSATVFSRSSEAGLRCLVVLIPDVFAAPSCAAHGNPIVDVMVWEGTGQFFDGEFPIGTVVRFELRGDAVDVWVAAATGDAATPAAASP